MKVLKYLTKMENELSFYEIKIKFLQILLSLEW